MLNRKYGKKFAMKILMLVNWKIEYCEETPSDKQPPDYYVKGEPYWFYRYFKEVVEVDVIDIRSLPAIEKFEKNKLHFYIVQTVRAISKIGKYDLVVSHGMQSGVALSLWRRLFKTKTKHLAFDIGSFNSSADSGFALKLMQFASKSLDGIIYHTSSQIAYYKRFFPWIVDKSHFIRFGTDLNFFNHDELKKSIDADSYILCVGYSKRDWKTLINAYREIHTEIKLRMVGKVNSEYSSIAGVEQIPFLPIKDLINQIYNAKFCVLPLEYFNYSYGQMTLLQQMALGKCVLVAKVPSIVDYVEDNMTAIMYKPGDVIDCQTKLKNLLDNDYLREKISKQGNDYLRLRCNEKVMAHEIENYLNLLKRGDRI